VVRFLHQHSESIAPQRSKLITDLGLQKGNVVTITNEETLIKGFMQIITHKISAIAIIDFKTGELINNLSASDMKGITQESFWKLELPLHQILTEQADKKLPPVTCSSNTNLGEIIDNFSKHGVHRIYVVDPTNKPLNVITLTDVMNVFTTTMKIA